MYIIGGIPHIGMVIFSLQPSLTPSFFPSSSSQPSYEGFGRDPFILGIGQNIVSADGKFLMILQNDGNLVLYTYQLASSCQKMADGNMGGGQGANALYELNQVGFPSNLGSVGYVDGDAVLHPYPSSMLGYSNEYDTYLNFDSSVKKSVIVPIDINYKSLDSYNVKMKDY